MWTCKLLDEVVGSVQQRKRKIGEMFSQELEQTKKRKPFKLCLVVKRKLLKEYNMNK
jgi:hypothetical protein